MAGHIVAIGGGPLLHRGAAIEDELLRLSGAERPHVCFLATAAVDRNARTVAFYRAFAARDCDVDHIERFGGPDDPLGRLAKADVVCVRGRQHREHACGVARASAAVVVGRDGLVEAIAQLPGATAYRVTPAGSEPLPTRHLA